MPDVIRADAVSEEGTVVVHRLDALAARAAVMRAGRFRATARDAQSAPFERAPGNLGVGGSIPVCGGRVGLFRSVSRLEWEAERRGGSRGVRGGVDVIPKDVEEEGEGERDGEGAEEASVAARDGGGVRDDGPSDGERDAGDDDDERTTGPAREDALERAPTLAGVSPEGGRVVDGQAPRAPERGAVRAGGELWDVQRQTAALKSAWKGVGMAETPGRARQRAVRGRRDGDAFGFGRAIGRAGRRGATTSAFAARDAPNNRASARRKRRSGNHPEAPSTARRRRPSRTPSRRARARSEVTKARTDAKMRALAGDRSSTSDATRAVRDTIVEKSISNARAGRDASMEKDIRRMPVSKYKTCARRYLRVGSSSTSLASSRRRRDSVAITSVALVSDLVASSHHGSLLEVTFVLLLHLGGENGGVHVVGEGGGVLETELVALERGEADAAEATGARLEGGGDGDLAVALAEVALVKGGEVLRAGVVGAELIERLHGEEILDAHVAHAGRARAGGVVEGEVADVKVIHNLVEGAGAEAHLRAKREEEIESDAGTSRRRHPALRSRERGGGHARAGGERRLRETAMVAIPLESNAV